MEHIPMHIGTSAPSASLHYIPGFLAPWTQQTFDGTLKDWVYETFQEWDHILIYSVFTWPDECGSRFKIQGFIRHILNYTEYNPQWNVSQVKSTQWTVQNT